MLNSDATLRMYLQYYEREISLSRIMAKAYMEASAKIVEPVEVLEVYVKPEDGKAYYVANSKFECHVNLWDSKKDISWREKDELSADISLAPAQYERKLIFEYRGHQCDCKNIINRCVEKFLNIFSAKQLEEVEIYLKVEDGAAYYVINGKYTGSVPLEM